MSNFGQVALRVVGTVVGAYFGGPGGAQMGYAIGGLVGDALFPTDLGTVEGPRLNDLTVQTSNIGAPIPIIYGRYAFSGNLIWSSGIIETVHKKKQGGKGGPTQTVKTYTYKVNCAIGICEGPIEGIGRIWADAKLLWDGRPQQPNESLDDYNARLDANLAFVDRFTLYKGDEDQLPDPTIEAFEGVGNISAFRGLAYMVFNEFQLEDYGNRVPNFRFETASVQQRPWQVTYSEWSGNDADISAQWLSGKYAATMDMKTRISTAVADFGREYPVSFNVVGYKFGSFGVEGIRTASSYVFETPPLFPSQKETLYGSSLITTKDLQRGFFLSDISAAIAYAKESVGVFYVLDTFQSVAYRWNSTLGSHDLGGASQVFTAGQEAYFSGRPDMKDIKFSADGTKLYILTDNTYSGHSSIYTANLDNPWDAGSIDAGDYSSIFTSSQELNVNIGPATGFCFADDGKKIFVTYSNRLVGRWDLATAWVPMTGTYVEQGNLSDLPLTASVNGIWFAQKGTRFWVLVHDHTLAETSLREYNIVPSDEAGIPLGDIVYDQCRRAGLSDNQIDVSDLTELVMGYAVTRAVPIRDCISPLRLYGRFDCVESGGKLKWPTRGKAIVVNFTDGDLAAREGGSQRIPSYEVTRKQEVDLPRRLRVHYAQYLFNYETGEQSASRLSGGSVDFQDVEIPVAMYDMKAAQLAEILLYEMWVSRNGYKISVPPSFLRLEPADAITIPVDGRQERLRITGMTQVINGPLQLEALKDDDGVYVSYAVPSAPAYSDTGGASVPVIGTALLVLLDLPLLRDADNDAGYYAAVKAEGSTIFGGVILYRSPDGGTTYEEVAVSTVDATIGTLQYALPAGSTDVIDEGNALYVLGLDTLSLESISDASLLAGLNGAAIGSDGRWEVIQFRTATLISSAPVTWKLTGLVRGRRGTEWAVGTSLVGDYFVLLDSALMRVPLNISGIGASRLHKAVLAGKSIEDTAAISFTGRGVALECYAPTDVNGHWTDTPGLGDFVITWVRRGRIGEELPGSVDIPLSEETESYEVDILDTTTSPDTVVRTLAVSTPTVTYTDAQITADFGSPVPTGFTIRIYQLSAVVGRGYPTEVTL